nr:putative ribonuclease H-like domain-containing protein [Tanacetum cinerariifolium]
MARTPQQNGVFERRNRTLIEAAKTMLADSKLLTTFWAEAVNTACYVQNRVLVVKPHNKTPYELFHGRTPNLSFMRSFRCLVIILNTKDHLGKFNGKADKGFFVGYSLISKAFKVFNSRTRIMEENLHIRFSENTPNVIGSGPDWLFDIDALTRTINYEPIVAGTQSNGFAGTKASDNVGQARKKTKPVKDYILLPLWTTDLPFFQNPKTSQDDGFKPSSDDGKKVDEDPSKGNECNDQEKEDSVNSTNNVNNVSLTVNDAGINEDNEHPFDPNMPALEDVGTFEFLNRDKDDDIVADMNNMDTTIQASPIPSTRINKDHPLDQVIGDLHSATQTRPMSKNLEEHRFVSIIQQRTNHNDLQNCFFACFLSQEEPKKVIHALKDPSWIETMQEELLQFKLQEMDVKSAFLYRKIKEEVYVCQTPRFEDLDFPDRVYKVEKALYGLHQAPKACSIRKELCNAFEKLMHEKFQMSSMGELTFFLGLQVKQKNDGIFISQDKYIAEILKKFGFTEVKNASTPMETQKPLLKDEDGEEVDVHVYESQIHARVDGKEIIITESSVMRDLRLENEEGVDCFPNYTIFENLELMGEPKRKNTQIGESATTASSLEAEQDSGNIDKTQSKATHNEASSLGTTSGGGPRYQEAMRDTIAQTRVLYLEKTKTTQALEITSLKRRVKKLKKKQRSRTHKLKRLYKRCLLKKKLLIKSTCDEEDQRLARESAQKEQKANIALIEIWDDIQAKINADYQLAQRLQAEEQHELTDVEKVTLFMVNTFVDFKTKLVEGSSKRAREELTQESFKKQKINDDKEIAELKELIEIILDKEEVAIDAISLAIKSPNIVD